MTDGQEPSKKKPTPKRLKAEKAKSKQSKKYPGKSKGLSGLGSLAAFIESQNPDLAKRQKDLGIMCSILQEYMSTYMLIGYTIDGELVSVTSQHSQRDCDSLNTALQRYIIENSYRQLPPPGYSE